MPTARITISENTDRKLRELAVSRNATSEELISGFIEEGISRAGRKASKIGIFLLQCFATAGLVLVGVWMLSTPVPRPPPEATFYTFFPPFVDWIGRAALSFVPWPITILLVALIIFRSANAFAALLGLFGFIRKVKVFGAEIELNEQTKHKLQSAVVEISMATQEYRKRINVEVERLSDRHQLDRNLGNFVDNDLMKRFSPHRESKFRCTIYIADPVHDERLYQLLDYYPSGAGAFRTYSERYGIIGKVWRAEERQLERNLLHGIEENAPHEEKISRIMQDWGMKRREAEAALTKPSYFCFLLTHEGSKVGLVYMDSERQGAFDEALANEVEAAANAELPAAISKLLNDLASVTLSIELRDY